MLQLALFLLLIALAPLAQARETAWVLPKGISRLRLVGVSTTGVRDTFNDVGKIQGVSNTLNRDVSIQDLAQAADPATRAQLQTLVGTLNRLQPGLGDNLAGSSIFSDVAIQQQIYLGAFEYGLTSKVSLGIRVPVVRRNIDNQFSATGRNNAAAASRALGDLSDDARAGLGGVGALDLNTGYFENALFASKGYDLPRSFSRTQLGDIELGGKYEIHKGESTYTSALVGLGLPTGAAYNIRSPFDRGNSREAWSYAAQLLQEVYPVKGLTLGANARLGYSLRDSRERAVPRSAEDSLPSVRAEDGQVENVARQRGLQLDSEVSAGYRFAKEKWGLWAAYQYASKGTDRFFGQGSLYYEGLSPNTSYQLHTAELGAEFSTISAFRAGSFPLPLEVTLLVNTPFAGVNSPMAPYARV
ncbi:MAG: hypothetical protein EOP11_16345, partial [Proteobacteria bacterium]